jgi:hypothetical protein
VHKPQQHCKLSAGVTRGAGRCIAVTRRTHTQPPPRTSNSHSSEDSLSASSSLAASTRSSASESLVKT